MQLVKLAMENSQEGEKEKKKKRAIKGQERKEERGREEDGMRLNSK